MGTLDSDRKLHSLVVMKDEQQRAPLLKHAATAASNSA
jgi:hypothetical protein